MTERIDVLPLPEAPIKSTYLCVGHSFTYEVIGSVEHTFFFIFEMSLEDEQEERLMNEYKRAN